MQRVVVLKDQTNKQADDCLRLYSESLEEPLRRSNRTAIWSNALFAFTQALSFFVIALIFWYGVVLKRQASTFQFFVGLMVCIYCSPQLLCSNVVDLQSTTFGAIQAGNIFSFVPDISSAKGAGSDIIKLLDSMPEVDAESTEGKIPDKKTIRGHIRFEGVHFRYPIRPGVRVLRDLSFEVEPGTYIALVGASGSGKSTMCDLLCISNYS